MSSSIVMDHNNIPSCALYRHIGTVIVRLKMEVFGMCCQRDVCSTSDSPGSIPSPSRCEQCTRTILINKCDCDRDIVDKCRPYRSSTARSRYVNVCAAVCLLLCVGGLSPLSSAAPGRSRTIMSRQRRATDYSYLWENPCDYADPSAKVNVTNPTDVAKKLVMQANGANTYATNYKDAFAKVYSYQTFEEAVSQNPGEWLRMFQFPDEVFPKEKVLQKNMPEEYINNLMNKIDDILPSMNKALKVIVAGLHSFSKDGLNDTSYLSDENVKSNLTNTMQDVRAVLCYFNDIMTARNLVILPLSNSEIAMVYDSKIFAYGVPLYRDTLNYLEYLGQVFKKLYGVTA